MAEVTDQAEHTQTAMATSTVAADDLQISNNRVENSTGFLSGGIRIGHMNLINEQGNTLEYTDSENSDMTITYNQVFRNGALDGAGGGMPELWQRKV